MAEHKTYEIGDDVPFWGAANDTGGSGADADSGDFNYDVRKVGDAANAEPTASGTGSLLSHANYPAGLYEVLIDTDGYAAGDYAVFATLLVDGENPSGFLGSFKLVAVGTSVHSIAADWADGGRLDALLDAIPTTAMRGTDNAALADKMEAFFQLALRGDAAIASDRSTELGEINANEGSGAGAFSNQTDGQEAIRDTAPMGTAMRGTDSAALAAKLEAYVQLLARSDAAIKTDRATELGEINANEGTGAGDWDPATDGQQATRDRGDAEWVTATGFAVAGDTMKVSAGTGTGQLDFTNGVVKSNLAQILGTALTETSGYIAAAFKKFFNVASPTGTVNSLPDATPDGAGGLPVSDGGELDIDTALGHLDADVSSRGTADPGDEMNLADGALAAAKIATGALTAAKFASGAFDAVWTVSTRTLTSFGTLASDAATAVWAASTRTLSSFGTLAADVWAYATRTLTEGGDATEANQDTIIANQETILEELGAASGSNTVVVTVDDGTNPLSGVIVSLRTTAGAADSRRGTTDVSGETTFSLDDGTYYMQCSLNGYTHEEEAVVVDESPEAVSLSMTAIPTPDAPATPGTLVIYADFYELTGVAVGSGEGTFSVDALISPDISSGKSWVPTEKPSDTTDANGRAELTLATGLVVKLKLSADEQDWLYQGTVPSTITAGSATLSTLIASHDWERAG